MKLPIFTIRYDQGLSNSSDEGNIDIHRYLIKDTQKTFLMRVFGDVGTRIQNGDILIVDSSIKPQSSDLVIARANKEFYIKRYVKKSNKVFLMDDSPEKIFEEYNSKKGIQIWGVITHVVHNTRAAVSV